MFNKTNLQLKLFREKGYFMSPFPFRRKYASLQVYVFFGM